MRAASNLAGVEFIAPPRYLNESIRNLWAEIITESGYFFTRDAMRFFGSRVVWDSLTQITQDTFGFITSEQFRASYYDAEPRKYTVRKWDRANGTNPLSEFQEFETLKAAKHYLTNAGWDRAEFSRSAGIPEDDQDQCQTCRKWVSGEELTEIDGLGSGRYVCENCWINDGEGN